MARASTTPDRFVTNDLKDRIRPTAMSAFMTIAPTVLAWKAWAYGLGLERNWSSFLVIVAATLLTMISMIAIAIVTNETQGDPRSLVNKGMRRLARRNRIATSAADMIRRDWHRSGVTAAQGVGLKGVDTQIDMRSTRIVLPTGAVVTVVNRHRKTPSVMLEPGGDPGARRRMGRAASLLIAAEVERRQLDALAARLGVTGAASAESMSRLIAALATGRPDERVYKSLDGLDAADHARRTYRLPADVTATTLGERDSPDVVELLVTAPGIGVVSLPTYGFGDSMREAEADRMERAFGVSRRGATGIPIFIGNARATRLAELARRGLDEDPDLADGAGNGIVPLFREHLPRLVDRHRASSRTARTEDMARIDAELDRGLDVIARALGEALDRLADGRLDHLRTEVRFLEARHPEHAPERGSLVPIDDERKGSAE